jgi:hypothetical protein
VSEPEQLFVARRTRNNSSRDGPRPILIYGGASHTPQVFSHLCFFSRL